MRGNFIIAGGRREVSIMLGALLVGACTLAGTAAATGSGTEPSAAGNEIEAVSLDFDAHGTSYVKKADSEVPLGPGSLHIDLDVATGTLSGDLALPPSQSSFTAFGVVPTTATVEFLPTEPLVGVLEDGAVNAVAKLNLKLSDVKAGPLELPAGDECMTSEPIDVTMTSVPGFDPLQGGDLVGTFEIPSFTDCQFAELAVNALVPGPGNRITLTIARKE